MGVVAMKKSKLITQLLNGTLSSLKTVVPIAHKPMRPHLLEKSFSLKFGVLIGLTGDITGKLILAGKPSVFGLIGSEMFDTPLEGEMLLSFSGEMGNMIAGGLSTKIAKNGININITYPTIMQGNTNLSGYKQALGVPILLDTSDELYIYLLLD